MLSNERVCLPVPATNLLPAPPVDPNEGYTFVGDYGDGWWVCEDCGAWARTIEDIEHFDN